MRLARSPARLGPICLLLGVLSLFGLAVVGAPAGAQAPSTTSPTTSPTGGQASLSQLAPGLKLLDGSITGNGPESGRRLDSSQATAFVQAWLPDSVFGNPPFEDPPPTLPVYQVVVDYEYQGTRGSMTVDYASDGTSAWVSMPPQNLWPGVVVTQQRWISAPDRTVAGFEGRLTPVPVPTVPPRAVAPTTSHNSSSTALVIAGLVVLVVLIAGVGLLVIRRRRAHPTSG